MFTTKSLFGLVVIAAGGFLNNAVNPTTAAAVSATNAVSSVSPGVSPKPVPGNPVQATAQHAVLAAIQTDFHDQSSQLRLSEFRFAPASSETLEGVSQGRLLFDGASSVPIVAKVVYDVAHEQIERVDYSLPERSSATNKASIDNALRSRIADVIGSRLVMEFAQQPVDFSLTNVRSVADGRDRLLIDGDGVTHFGGEGDAYTRFVAVADKFSGRVVAIKYDLLNEMRPETKESTGATN
jgi:hypothetical protein